jgi:ureidoglycolate lyase
MKIKSKHIDENNFKSYGKIVKDPARIAPTSQASDYKFWSDIANYNIEGNTEIGICVVYKQAKNKISAIERHLQTPEILIPIDGPVVLPVLNDEKHDDEVEAFLVSPGEAVVINKGVWHGACIPIGKNQSSYFVIFRKGTSHEDVEKKNIKPVELA